MEETRTCEEGGFQSAYSGVVEEGVVGQNTWRVIQGDCTKVLPDLAVSGERFHACVCDPPYHLTSIVKRFKDTSSSDDTQTSDRSRKRVDGYARLSSGFMGQQWDGGDVAFRPETWRAVWGCLLPGAFLLAFGGTRNWHRLACAIEDAGFEIRDTIAWMYFQGFPKSHDVSKNIDKHLDVDRKVVGKRVHPALKDTSKLEESANAAHGDNMWAREWDLTEPATSEAAKWQGFGTALKPAYEPVIVARKPLDGTIAQNVLKHGCGGLNIDGCRVPVDPCVDASQMRTMARNVREQDTSGQKWGMSKNAADEPQVVSPKGRWPANVVHDGSDEVLSCFPEANSARANGNPNNPIRGINKKPASYNWGEIGQECRDYRDTGSAARFFYCAKANKTDRANSSHPTVKPQNLMRYLTKLVCPPNGRILDPFAGSGSTLEAAIAEGFNVTGIERESEYVGDIILRMAAVQARS